MKINPLLSPAANKTTVRDIGNITPPALLSASGANMLGIPASYNRKRPRLSIVLLTVLVGIRKGVVCLVIILEQSITEYD